MQARIAVLEKRARNAQDREDRAKTKVKNLMKELQQQKLMNEELRSRLECYSRNLVINKTFFI